MGSKPRTRRKLRFISMAFGLSQIKELKPLPGPKIMGPKAKESWYLKTARFVLGKIDDFDKKQTWYSPRRTYSYF